MEGTTRAIALCRMKADQVTLPVFTAEDVTYSDVRVKAQFAMYMDAVSASVKVEYLAVRVNTRDLTSTVVGPSSVSYLSCFVASAS